MVAPSQDNTMKLSSPQDRAGAARVFPMSFAQQRLWMLDRLLPPGAVYNMPKFVRLVGALDVAALRGALNEVVRRHEALRTTFAVDDGAPVQVIMSALELASEVEDLRGLPKAERHSRLAGLGPSYR